MRTVKIPPAEAAWAVQLRERFLRRNGRGSGCGCGWAAAALVRCGEGGDELVVYGASAFPVYVHVHISLDITLTCLPILSSRLDSLPQQRRKHPAPRPLSHPIRPTPPLPRTLAEQTPDAQSHLRHARTVLSSIMNREVVEYCCCNDDDDQRRGYDCPQREAGARTVSDPAPRGGLVGGRDGLAPTRRNTRGLSTWANARARARLNERGRRRRSLWKRTAKSWRGERVEASVLSTSIPSAPPLQPLVRMWVAPLCGRRAAASRRFGASRGLGTEGGGVEANQIDVVYLAAFSVARLYRLVVFTSTPRIPPTLPIPRWIRVWGVDVDFERLLDPLRGPNAIASGAGRGCAGGAQTIGELEDGNLTIHGAPGTYCAWRSSSSFSALGHRR